MSDKYARVCARCADRPACHAWARCVMLTGLERRHDSLACDF